MEVLFFLFFVLVVDLILDLVSLFFFYLGYRVNCIYLIRLFIGVFERDGKLLSSLFELMIMMLMVFAYFLISAFFEVVGVFCSFDVFSFIIVFNIDIGYMLVGFIFGVLIN